MRWLGFGLLLLGACSSAGPAPGPAAARRGIIAGPPAPGTSITHTRMCSCTVCAPTACCAGDVSDLETAPCDDGYDFTRCSISVHSCAGSCHAYVWRVPRAASCESTRHPDCCG